MVVTKLDLTHQAVFLQMLEDYDAHDPHNGEFYERGRGDFPAYVQRLDDEEHGINIRPGWVPCSHRWLLDETSAIVGIVRIRHNINTPFLAEEAGHIGYDVPPSQRGQGYGIACLQAGLEVARALCLERVLLCADTDNPASWRTIEHCGGVLEVERFSAHYKKPFRRYWIETGFVP
jgi:predicted acetyltransferase